MTKLDQKLNKLANDLQGSGCALLLLAALGADGQGGWWPVPALLGLMLALCGLGLGWLCTDRGRALRRRGRSPAPQPQTPTAAIIPFPKAG